MQRIPNQNQKFQSKFQLKNDNLLIKDCNEAIW